MIEIKVQIIQGGIMVNIPVVYPVFNPDIITGKPINVDRRKINGKEKRGKYK